jgi:hypothetical protein
MADLRPYQADVIRRVDAEIAAGRRRVLLVAPTGAEKRQSLRRSPTPLFSASCACCSSRTVAS